MHHWTCSDTPGIFNCQCGSVGYFNRETQEIEVEDVKTNVAIHNN
jgi:hypothetical protein